MPLATEITKVAEDSPDRCQAVIGKTGQCLNAKVTGTNYCPVHGGARAAKHLEQQSLNRYRAALWKSKIGAMSSGDNIKDLRDEIGILRVMLDEQLESCTNSAVLLQNSGRIGDLVMKIERTVSTCQRIDKELGQFIDKQTAVRIGQEIVSILAEQISSTVDTFVAQFGLSETEVQQILTEALIDRVTTRIAEVIEHTQGKLPSERSS